MKRDVRPVNQEIPYPDNKLIVSKTDTKGRITYCNELFIEMSGFEEEELLGEPHNIVRHPDMPKIIFQLLWDTIQSGEEINAYVKNMSKDGRYYWVLANVTPSFDKNDRIIGYLSARRKPIKSALDIIIPLYKELLSLEKQGGVNASKEKIDEILREKGVSYEEFILSI